MGVWLVVLSICSKKTENKQDKLTVNHYLKLLKDWI